MSVLKHHIEPLANLMQDLDAPPWLRHRKLREFIEEESCSLIAALSKTKQVVRLTVLVRSYLAKKDLKMWWSAWLTSPAARKLPSIWYKYMAEIVLQGTMQKCDLVIAPLDGVHVHPACQCLSLPQRVPGTTHIARGGQLITSRARVTMRGCQYRVPHWVARSRTPNAKWVESFRTRPAQQDNASVSLFGDLEF